MKTAAPRIDVTVREDIRVLQQNDGKLYAVEKGKPTRSLSGDKVAFHLAAELQDAREKLDQYKAREKVMVNVLLKIEDWWRGEAQLVYRNMPACMYALKKLLTITGYRITTERKDL